MSMKKKLGSKLSEGVRQVKSQREPVPAAKTAPVAKPAAQTMPTSTTADKPASPANKPETPRAATQAKTNLNKHPLRVWPD